MYTQSPSIEDLLSARSKAQTLSIYSTLTTHTTFNNQLDTSTLLPADISEAARRAMAEEASNGLWSPSMESSGGDLEDDQHIQKHFIPPPSPDLTEESDYSPSLSIASVRIVSRVPSANGDGGNVPTAYTTMKARRGSIDMLKSSVYKGASQPEEEAQTDSNTANPAAKRVLNSRNLAINTQNPPQQLFQPAGHRSVTPDPTRSRYAHLDLPLTSRSLPPSQAQSTTPVTSSFPSAPLSAVPAHVATITAASHTRRRSSQGSYSSSVCLSPVDDENVTSLQRMQSFLGPKMKHISPAPWQLDPSLNNEGIGGSESAPSETSFWNDEDFEIGSVQVAIKTPRSRSVREALGMAASTDIVPSGITGRAAATKGDLSALCGLGLALETRAAKPPVTQSDEAAHSSTPTTSSIMPRSFSKDSIRPSPLSSSSAKTSFEQPTMTVSNIVRTRSPDPASAVVQPILDTSRVPVSSVKADNNKAAHLVRRRSITAEAAFSSSQPSSSLAQSVAAARPSTPPENASIERPKRVDVIARKRPPLVTKDSGCSVQTTTTSYTKPSASPSVTSMSSLPSPTPKANDSSAPHTGPSGLKLISLDAAREREKDRIGNSAVRPSAAPSAPTHSVKTSLPPLPQQQPQQAASQAFTKAVKSKKSGFLKLFKQKDDSSGAPMPLPRAVSPDMPSPAASVRTVYHPVDPTPLPSSSTQAVQTGLEVVNPHNVPLTEASRKANVSAPPTVTFAAPSPDTVDIPVFPDPPARQPTANAQKKPAPIALAPSLSLRPVSMMISSMPQDFLANLSAIESKKRGAISEGSRTPDTASFVFFDGSSTVTPPPGTPAALSSSAPNESSSSKTAYGLPTPPHSADSSRTFSTPGISAKAEAAYQAKIIDLEKLVMTLKVELDAAQQAKDKDVTHVQRDQSGQNANKACDKCGCTCRTANSVLARPRVIGHGNMFSSGRD